MIGFIALQVFLGLAVECWLFRGPGQSCFALFWGAGFGLEEDKLFEC